MSNPVERTTSATLPDEVVRPQRRVESVEPSKAEQVIAPVVDSTKEPRPIPTMGWPKLWYSFGRLFSKNLTPPRLSKKEIAMIAAAVEAARRVELTEDSIAYLRHLTDDCPHLSVVFIGVKGAAATTATMVNVSSTIADDTRTLVYGCDFNPASGSAGARLGKDFGETISIQEFASIVEQVKGSRQEVNARLRPTRYGVRVLSADNYTDIPDEQYGKTTATMLNVLDENCDYLMLDSPNDITTPAARAILKKADVFVFTANVGVPDSLRMLHDSMETARKLGYRDKVKHSVVVISNTPEGATLGDYSKYLKRVNILHEEYDDRPVSKEDFNGQMLMVPSDPAIANDGRVNLEAYRWATRQAYRDISVAILEQALEMKQNTSILSLRGGRSYSQDPDQQSTSQNSH